MCSVERKHMSISSGNRILWQKGKWALQMPALLLRAHHAVLRAAAMEERDLQEFPPVKKHTLGIFAAEWHLFRVWITARYHGIITKNPLTPNWLQSTQQTLWLFMAMSLSECSHLALWFNYRELREHREIRATETAIGHGLSITRCLGRTQHHRRKLDTSAGIGL